MDTITQGLLGAVAAQAIVPRQRGRRVWLYGALGGMAADVDIFFEMAANPMLGLRYHRHFTHALAFIPIGGLLVALPFLLRNRDRAQRRAIAIAATVGYATHGPLDAFTTYGTVLLWPLTSMRVAFDSLSIVDPLVSLGLLIATVLAARRLSARPARIALAALAAYIGLGAVQNRRAASTVRALARARGHTPERLRALPLVFSNMRWRVCYEAGGRAYLYDATIPWLGTARAREGESYALVREQDLEPAARDDPRTRDAFAEFLWFADGWVGWSTDDGMLGDNRYSASPGRAEPMWGIRLHPDTDRPVELVRRTPTVDSVFRGLEDKPAQ